MDQTSPGAPTDIRHLTSCGTAGFRVHKTECTRPGTALVGHCFQASRRFALLLPDLTGMKEIALHWIGEYGYAGIFSLLIFGIVGLPVPDEWLLTFSGFLVFKRTLLFVPTFAAEIGR